MKGNKFITEQEEKVSKLIVDACNEFLKLHSQHPDEQRDFVDGIHKCQGILMERVARAARPDLFPIKSN